MMDVLIPVSEKLNELKSSNANMKEGLGEIINCLLYTSDAADE